MITARTDNGPGRRPPDLHRHRSGPEGTGASTGTGTGARTGTDPGARRSSAQRLRVPHTTSRYRDVYSGVQVVNVM